MKNYLQLFLIFFIYSFVEGSPSLVDEKCVKLKNLNLHIPDNPIVEGEGKKAPDSWYQHVNWKDTPGGHLTLDFTRVFEVSQEWVPYAASSMSFRSMFTEEIDWEEFVRTLLGFNRLSEIPGRVRTPQTIFDEDQSCTLIHFKGTLPSGQHRVYLDYIDEDRNWLLTGQISFSF